MWVGWHLHGAFSWTEFAGLTEYERAALREELGEQIERHNDALEGK